MQFDESSGQPPETSASREPTNQTPTEDQASKELSRIYNEGAPSDPPDDGPQDRLGSRMTFLEHLDELRRRILQSIYALLVGFAVGWIFREQIFDFLAQPIYDAVQEQLVIIKPTEAFTIYLKVAFAAAIFLAIPWILFQVWLFIAPGLYRKEKLYALPFLLSSTILFLVGGAFAYYVVLPPALNFLLNVFGQKFKPLITAVEYFDFEVLILVGMGAIFQLPILVGFLSIFGIVTPRFLWKNFRYAFLLIVIIAALVSPTTDPFNLFIWSGPMVLLYLVSIVVSWLFNRSRAKRLQKALSPRQ